MSVLETNSIPNFPEHYPNTVPRECYESYGDLAALLNVKVLRLSKTIQLCRKISFFSLTGVRCTAGTNVLTQYEM